MSNAERQRRFQAAHPGYDRRRKARQRGMVKRAVSQIRAKLLAEALSARAMAKSAESVPAAAPAMVLALPAPPARLMLPAPVEMVLIPGMNAIGLMCEASRHPLAEPAAIPAKQSAAA